MRGGKGSGIKHKTVKHNHIYASIHLHLSFVRGVGGVEVLANVKRLDSETLILRLDSVPDVNLNCGVSYHIPVWHAKLGMV